MVAYLRKPVRGKSELQIRLRIHLAIGEVLWRDPPKHLGYCGLSVKAGSSVTANGRPSKDEDTEPQRRVLDLRVQG